MSQADERGGVASRRPSGCDYITPHRGELQRLTRPLELCTQSGIRHCGYFLVLTWVACAEN